MREAVTKAESKLQILYSEVYAPDRPDTDNEYMKAEEIQKMAHEFLREAKVRKIDTYHNNKLVEGAAIVESFVARENDPDFIPGSWVVGIHIPDKDVWAKVEKGELAGLSMEAEVFKETQEVEVEIPDVVRGMTTKSEDHEHEFFVRYDEQGRFIGGVTSMVDGHRHVIKAGTRTEETDNHRHGFSSVDNVQIVGKIED